MKNGNLYVCGNKAKMQKINQQNFHGFFTLIELLMRSSIRVKIRNFTLRSKNLEQGTRKEEVEKQLNN